MPFARLRAIRRYHYYFTKRLHGFYQCTYARRRYAVVISDQYKLFLLHLFTFMGKFTIPSLEICFLNFPPGKEVEQRDIEQGNEYVLGIRWRRMALLLQLACNIGYAGYQPVCTFQWKE